MYTLSHLLTFFLPPTGTIIGLHALRDAVCAVEPAVALEARRIIHAVDVQVFPDHSNTLQYEPL